MIQPRRRLTHPHLRSSLLDARIKSGHDGAWGSGMARLTDDSFIAIYILASGRNGTLYIGVSSDLPARIAQHKQGLRPGFTATYGVKRLVWYERHAFITEAIRRERAIKGWLRNWKLKLIEDLNPDWRDLSEDWFD